MRFVSNATSPEMDSTLSFRLYAVHGDANLPDIIQHYRQNLHPFFTHELKIQHCIMQALRGKFSAQHQLTNRHTNTRNM